MNLPITVGYAVLAMSCLSRCPGDRHQAPDIAECTSVPLDFLRKILKRLEAADFLDSKRGYHGGYRMNVPPESITLADLVRTLEPRHLEPRCFFGLRECSEDRACSAHAFWKSLRGQIFDYLESTTLDQVAEHAWNPAVLGDLSDGLVQIGGLLPSESSSEST